MFKSRQDPETSSGLLTHFSRSLGSCVDRCELIREILGKADCPVSSTKGVWGHLLGAAGSVEAILSVRAMIDGFLPPQVGLLDPDPDCPLSFVREPVAANLANVVSNSYGFGGNNVSLALSRS